MRVDICMGFCICIFLIRLYILVIYSDISIHICILLVHIICLRIHKCINAYNYQRTCTKYSDFFIRFRTSITNSEFPRPNSQFGFRNPYKRGCGRALLLKGEPYHIPRPYGFRNPNCELGPGNSELVMGV